jgi:PAS domain-containing protein
MSSSRTRSHKAGNCKKTKAELFQELKILRDKNDFLMREFGCKDVSDKQIAQIKERKRVEEALRESEAKFLSMLDDSRDVIYRYNVQTDHFSIAISNLQAKIDI